MYVSLGKKCEPRDSAHYPKRWVVVRVQWTDQHAQGRGNALGLPLRGMPDFEHAQLRSSGKRNVGTMATGSGRSCTTKGDSGLVGGFGSISKRRYTGRV